MRRRVRELRAPWRGLAGCAAVLGVIALLGAGPAVAGGRELLFWAPYSPGSPEQAAGALEELARYLEKSTGWPTGSASASYRNTVDGGLEAVKEDAPGFLVVPIPVYLRYHEALDWRPIRSVVLRSADSQRYTLYGPAGSTLGSLEGAVLSGDAAYDPVFVNALVLGGAVSVAEEHLRPTSRPLSAVRKAARGDAVMVLLDEGQRTALGSLPAPVDLALLAESGWMPAALVVRSGSASEDDAAALGAALDRCGEDPAAADLMETLRLRRFEGVEMERLETLSTTYWSTEEDAAPGQPAKQPARPAEGPEES